VLRRPDATFVLRIGTDAATDATFVLRIGTDAATDAR